MNDTRVKSLRDAVERLVESLDATIRVERWELAESVPEPLSQSAKELVARLETANRLAASKFTSSTADAAAVNASRVAIERLTAAYRAYEASAATQSRRAASMILEEEIGQVRSETNAW